MRKREWIISICILCVMALAAAVLTRFVLYQNQPANVAAFEKRFMDLTQLGITVSEGMELSVELDEINASWQEGEHSLTLETAVQPIPSPCDQWQIDLSGGGKQNTVKHDQWGYRVWLELHMLRGDVNVATAKTEMFFEAMQDDRSRIYTLQADAREADGWQVRVMIEPLDGQVAEGSLILEHWEVWAK